MFFPQTQIDADEYADLRGYYGRATARPYNDTDIRSHMMKPQSLSSCVAGFKSSTTTRINTLRNTPGIPVWQRNFYERVIRDDRELTAIRAYIAANPVNWKQDEENPEKEKNRYHHRKPNPAERRTF